MANATSARLSLVHHLVRAFLIHVAASPMIPGARGFGPPCAECALRKCVRYTIIAALKIDIFNCSILFASTCKVPSYSNSPAS